MDWWRRMASDRPTAPSPRMPRPRQSRRASSSRRPTSWSPMGRRSALQPAGTTMAGQAGEVEGIGERDPAPGPDRLPVDLQRRRLADRERWHGHRRRRQEVVALEEAIEGRPERVTTDSRACDLDGGHPAAGLDQRDERRIHAGALPLEVVPEGGGKPRVPERVGHVGGILEARIRLLHASSRARASPRTAAPVTPQDPRIDGRVAEPRAPGDARGAPGGRTSARV